MKTLDLAKLLLLICIVSLSACRNDNMPSRGTEATASDAAAAPHDGPPGPEPRAGGAASHDADGDALAVLNAVNDHEIAMGRQALEKNVTGPVADYARRMIDEHGKNRQQTDALHPDPDSANARAQMKKGQDVMQQLATQNGQAYQRAYVQAMVAGHTDALSALDQTLIPAATRPDVQAHLQQTRTRVAQHLDQARALAAADTPAQDAGSTP
ncbi:DUF4142 domain-containing protein [Stenotrophomonas sp. PS02297]|uniref:DUF4142 domain-containing protein n=1 Tax=Stenotrophomonas sp. PS02297 TaxID=2991423 RepID=UPI002499D73C|nr:DUF4142 domain-containing protein [Stenotrophomonas sp. PS02297]